MEFEDLKGKTLIDIKATDGEIILVTSEGDCYYLSGDDGPPNDVRVWVESIVGDLKDILNTPILSAEESSSVDSVTWTFYKLATIKGYLDIRFCGESNGYYCEKAVLHNVGKIDLKEYVPSVKSKGFNKFKY